MIGSSYKIRNVGIGMLYYSSMPIPTYDELFTDVLEVVADGLVYHRDQVVYLIAERLNLSKIEQLETLPSGENTARNRIHWAQTYLAQADAISRPKRGYLRITPVGEKLLSENPDGITLKTLSRTPGIRAWKDRRHVEQFVAKVAESQEAKNLDDAPLVYSSVRRWDC
jgi:restriction system protein